MLKNITLSADKHLLENARKRAAAESKSLNEIFREWLKNYISQDKNAKDYKDLMKKLSYASPGGHFSRDDLNER